MLNALIEFGQEQLGVLWPVVWTLLKVVSLVIPLLLCVAYLTWWERKMIGFMHMRCGPNRVGPMGLLQPIADAAKLLLKELILPLKANSVLYFIGPMMAIMPALLAWVVIPFSPGWALSNANAGLLLLVTITSLEVYGVILAGWASNSKYPLLAAMRASAQMISYELAIGVVLVVVLMVSGSLNLTRIVNGQAQGHFAEWGWSFLSWNWLPLFPLFVIYLVSAVAETNRHPFDVVEGESEIVAGHMVEYSGMGFAVFFLAEYANMILLSVLASIMFLGGWLPPFSFLSFIPGFIWLALKAFVMVSLFIWFRATFPRYRYDQIMRLGWKIFLPVGFLWLVLIAIWMQTPLNIWLI